jgi:transmembrane sensor
MQQFHIRSVDDLVANSSFKKWILLKDEQEALRWNQWLSLHPEKLEWVAAARTIVLLLAKHQHHLSDLEIDAAAKEIQYKILSQTEFDQEADIEEDYTSATVTKPLSTSFFSRRLWWAAASVATVILITVLSLNYNRQNEYNIDSPLFAPDETGSLFFKNNTDSAQTIVLPDTTEIILTQGASIRYAGGGSLMRREAYLEGDAFFKVAHNPSKPFIVYTKNIVTKVLGTSFWIKAPINQKKATVIVKTGKVSVFKKEKFTLNDVKPGVLDGLLITPNQQVSFDETLRTIKKGVVSAPEVSNVTKAVNVEFDETPAIQVFEWLEDVYAIPIVLDEQTLSGCSITASFAQESFFDKIAIICKIINAKYEEIDGSIVISSKGCK